MEVETAMGPADHTSVQEVSPSRPKGELLQEGFDFQRKGDFAAAEASYRRILDADPLDGDALYLVGFLYHQQGDNARAVPHLVEAVAQRPCEPMFLKGLGDALLAGGQRDRARECYLRAVSADPTFVGGLIALGEIEAVDHNLEDAVRWFRTAIDKDPKSVRGYVGLGRVLRDLENYEGAERCLRLGITLEPDSFEAIATLGEVRMKQGYHAEAEACFRHALDLRPGVPQVLNNLGSALKEQGRPAEAIPVYLDAYEREPQQAAVSFNLGGAYSALGRRDEAIRWYDRATAVAPDYAEAHANKSLLLLQAGDFRRGWKEYQWRFKINDPRQKIDARVLPGPEWDGGAFDGKTLLVRSEQGAGDMIQFCRYLPLVKARGGRVILETHRRLSRLLKNVDGADRIITIAETANTPFDLWTPLLSIPAFFTHSLESIPCAKTYLSPEAELVAATRIHVARERFAVGLCWQGNREYVGDRERSLHLSALEPLLRLPGIRFYSLQKGDGVDQIAALPESLRPEDLGSRLDNGGDGFVETAAAMMHLDLVISTDTAIPHLAGALGRPVWLLLSSNPEWRWFQAGDRSPWYPSMTLFRRADGEPWDALVQRVAERVQEHHLTWQRIQTQEGA